MVTVDRLTTNWVGLSSDPKPTECRNGDTYVEIDTSTLYAYDEENQQWVKQYSGGGSDSGGSSDGETDSNLIYDGLISLTPDENSEDYYIGDFTPVNIPDAVTSLKVVLFDATYYLENVHENVWANGEYLALIYDTSLDEWYFSVASAIIPSGANLSNVHIEVTKESTSTEPK